jgi:hypothetical protein
MMGTLDSHVESHAEGIWSMSESIPWRGVRAAADRPWLTVVRRLASVLLAVCLWRRGDEVEGGLASGEGCESERGEQLVHCDQ